MEFLAGNRLNGFARMAARLGPQDAEKMAPLTRMREAMVPGVMNLVKPIGEAEA